MLFFFGAIVFLGIFGGMLWVNAHRWRYLSKFYATTSKNPTVKRRFQNAVLLGLGGFNSLKGILTVGIHDAGMSLRVMPPFSIFHSPLFIPFDDISSRRTSWYLNAPSSELEFLNAPEVKIVMPTEQIEWVQKFAGNKVRHHKLSADEGRAGQGWRTLLIVLTAIILIMSGYLFFYFMFCQVF